MSANMGWWDKPVPIRRGGITVLVNNVRKAAELLLEDEWGWEEETHYAAARACMEALEGGNVTEAREAFAAAVEARGK